MITLLYYLLERGKNEKKETHDENRTRDFWITIPEIYIHNASGYKIVEIFQSQFSQKFSVIWHNGFGELLIEDLSVIIQSFKFFKNVATIVFVHKY